MRCFNYRLGPEASTVDHYTDIAGQMDAGSRFFDLRIAPDNGVLKTFHGDAAGRWGQRADLIFQQVDTFLTNSTRSRADAPSIVPAASASVDC